jgi:hypothetical protein|nr:MAG TPA: head to tail adaptor [Caudoviricetes sp.]
MIMTVAELRQFVTTGEEDQALEARLQALELLIRAYTNNNFQQRGFRIEADIRGGVFMSESLIPFAVGDTVMISQSDLQSDCLCTVKEITDDTTFTVNESCADDDCILVTKVVYPADVKLGVANMLKWQLDNGNKVGVASETISRHSVTYFDMTGDNSAAGFPKALTGFLRPYMKARFGRGLRV